MVDRLSSQLGKAPGGAGRSEDDTVDEEPGIRAVPGAADVRGMPNVLASSSGGVAAPGQSFPPNPPPANRFNSPATLDSRPGKIKFGPGFELKTNDDEYILQFHNVTHAEYRGYEQSGQFLVHDTFAMPREWMIFSGRITQPIGFLFALANSYDSVSMLDGFIDLTVDPKLTFRIGRFKTPFTYEFFVGSVQALLTPERSVFFNNFGENRDIGGMAYGRLFEAKMDYAVGIFNGSRNGYVANLDAKSMSAYLNFKPFNSRQDSLGENFNIGGSVFTGTADNLPVPSTLRTAIPTSGNSTIGIPFLTWNANVRETGPRAFWDLHMAWFYKHLALMAEWQAGFQDYSLTNDRSSRTHLPVESFYVEAGYYLTGEVRSGMGLVKPLHPFDLRPGHVGFGAFELVGRYDFLDVGSQVYKNGLTDPNNNANRLWMTDFGLNWSLNQYLKLYLDWEHVEFNQPVGYAPGKRQITNDMFWARLQFSF